MTTQDKFKTEGAWEPPRRCCYEPPIVWWGDQMYDAEMLMLKNETPQEKTLRLSREVAQEEKSYNGLVKFSTNKKEEKWCSKNGQMKFRVPTPCKYASLFAQRICAAPKCGKKVPEGLAKCSCGEVLAGCWSHTKNSCIYVHPDEEQWEAACSGELAFDRQQQVFHLKTQPLQAPNRFVAMAQQAKQEPMKRTRFAERTYENTRFAEPKKAVPSEIESAW